MKKRRGPVRSALLHYPKYGLHLCGVILFLSLVLASCGFPGVITTTGQLPVVNSTPQAQPLPVPRHQHQTQLDPFPDRFMLKLTVAKANLAAGFRVQPHQALEQFGSAGTHQAEKGQDLASPEGEGNVFEGKTAPDAWQG